MKPFLPPPRRTVQSIRNLRFALAVIAVFCLWSGCPAPASAQQLPTTRYTANVNGAQISYAITGGGNQTMLLIHGYPLNGDLFEAQRQAFGKQFRVITVDLRGFGLSTAPNGTASIDTYANDVLALLDQLGLNGNIILGGHSMGGAIALRMYQYYPNRFIGLILNDPAAMPPPVAEQGMWQGFVDQSNEGPVTFLPLLVPNFLTGYTRANDPAISNATTNLILQASVRGLSGGAQALKTRPDFSQVFPNIRIPTLLLYGQEDTLTPVEQAGMLHVAIPNSTLAVVIGASHALVQENPTAANESIAVWLSKSFGITVQP